MLAVAEQRLGTAELTTVKKRLEAGVNTAKEREAEQRRKATAGKGKKPNTAKVGGATDTYDEESHTPYFSGSASGGGGGSGEPPEASPPTPFVRTVHQAEECVGCTARARASPLALPPLPLTTLRPLTHPSPPRALGPSCSV